MSRSNEIGGYFGLEINFQGKEYHNALNFNRAKASLEFVLVNRGIKRIFVPDYACRVIFEACSNTGAEIVRYDTDERLMISNIDAGKDDCVYLINYFGQYSNDDIAKLKKQYGRVIVDNIQSFFDMPTDGVDTIYSCRKYFGVPDGAYLYTDEALYYAYNKLPMDNSSDRYRHIIGRIDSSASDYYEESRRNEEILDASPVSKMSLSTRGILKGIDYNRVIEIRRNNFLMLHEKYRTINKLKILREAGLFMYPLYIDNGNDLRKILHSNKIYSPTLWPELRESGNARSVQLTDNIILLPIDQRYGSEEMDFIINIVEDFLR